MATARKTTKKPAAQPSAEKQVAREMAIAKLASSGLDESDLDLLRMVPLSPSETEALHGSYRPLHSLKITYWDPRNPDEPLSCLPGWPHFYRLRYLRPDGDKKDDVRYVNEPMAGVVAYFPPNVDWPDILEDVDSTLIITEGELKAAKACKEGCPAIGLGGVWNFKSSALGVTFLKELEAVRWARRRVYIVFDSDVLMKTGVMDALNALAEQLKNRGALPYMVLVPEGDDGKKQGLDDYLVNNPLVDIRELTTRAQPMTEARKLFELNDQLIYVADPGIIVRRANGFKMSPGAMKEHALSNIDYSEQILRKDGSVSLQSVPIAMSWLKWPLRAQVASMTYKPGAAKIINEDQPDHSMWNTWPGWGCEPTKGDVKPFLKLVDHLFTGAEPGAKEWFIRWCAYPLQHPGTKLYSNVLFWGRRHGTGKSAIGYTLGKIYGKNFAEINQADLHANFNDWAENKQFILGDDVTGSDKRQDNDLLKKMITQKMLRINAKFMPPYSVPDCINYFFTSNHPDSFFLEDDDRRGFIHEVLVGPLDEEFYVDYSLWMDTDGPAALFEYLLRVDLGDFNPAAPAFFTAAKSRMISDAKSDLGSWIHRLLADPDTVLSVGEIKMKGDLFTNRQLLLLYDPNSKTRTTANGLGRELARAGAAQINNGKPIRGPEGLDRYYAIRNIEKWLTASPAEIHEHLFGKAPKDVKAKPRKF